MQTIISSSDPVCPIGYINFTKLRLANKESSCAAAAACGGSSNNTNNGGATSLVPPELITVKTSLDYISDLKESSYNDLSDPDLSETELEQIEMENRLRESMTKEEIISHSRSNSISLHANAALATSGSSPIKILTKSESYEERGDGAADDVLLRNPQFRVQHEQNPIQNVPNVVCNAKGWMWLSGVQGAGDTAAVGMRMALECVRDVTAAHDYQLAHICYVTLYVHSMAKYSELNEIYAEFFNFTNPPTRVCVECPLPDGLQVVVEVVAYRPPAAHDRRHTMHVQGISHWAPANIGPYSQSTRIGEITYISGQIALVPGSMQIVAGGIKPQCQLALRHLSRIAKAMNAQGQLRDVVQGICFVTHPSFISEARRQWERRTANAIVDYIVLSALPRQALVEWQVWAHTHNDKFDCKCTTFFYLQTFYASYDLSFPDEETGCSVGDYNVFSRRRWNYESNCAAIVCYVSTGLATSTTQLTELSDDIIDRHRRLAQQLSAADVQEIFAYTLMRILKGQSTKTAAAGQTDSGVAANTTHRPAIHFKIFYQVNAAPSIDMLIDAIAEFRERCETTAKFAFTVLPACSLQNFSTFLSICGIKHE